MYNLCIFIRSGSSDSVHLNADVVVLFAAKNEHESFDELTECRWPAAAFPQLLRGLLPLHARSAHHAVCPSKVLVAGKKRFHRILMDPPLGFWSLVSGVHG